MRLLLRLSCVRPLAGGVLLALLLAGMAGAGSIEAATLVVTNVGDSGAGSLRDVIAAAGDGDTIQFDPALNGQTIGLTSNELVINKDITINGLGPDSLAVSRTSSVRFMIIHILSGHTVTLAGLTISGGHAEGIGGGIWNEANASLTITNCIVSNNFSEGYGGGILSDGTLTIVDSIVTSNVASFTTGNPLGYGGGIFGGTQTIIRSTISNNTADIEGGGIIGGGMIITDSTISGNRAGSDGLQASGVGGGLFIGGTVEIRNSTISGNTASGEDYGYGGGVENAGSLTISNSTISGNFANQDGGGIRSAADSGSSLTILNSTISDNRANGNGGGIIISGGSPATLEIGNTILKAGTGANIVNDDGGTVTSFGYNLSSDNGGGFLTAMGDQINTNPMLGPLQDNGGSPSPIIF